MKRRKLSSAVVASILLAGATTLWGIGPASAASGPATTPVAQGVGPQVLKDATVFGNTPSNTPVQISIVLRTTNTQALQQYIQETVTPGPAFRQFLSVSQFAQMYGQPQSVVQAITSYLAQYGIQTSVYPNNLAITANGTAGQFDQAFSVNLQNMSFQGKPFHGTIAPPMMPPGLADPILAVLGLTDYSNFASDAIKALPQVKEQGGAGNIPAGGYTPSFLEQHYNVTPLYKAGDMGQGQTIGIVTLASLNPSDAYTFWKMEGLSVNPNRIVQDLVDGGSGAVSLSNGSEETTLDVEQSGALAPDANVIVYEAPGTDYGYADAFWSAITQNIAGSISTSWGESEDAISSSIASGEESPNYAQVFNEAFMEAAAQGISTFAAAGDAGAYDASRDIGTTDLSVDSPADSPYVTAAGGTTVAGTQNYGSFSITVPQERAWGWDYLWPYYAGFGAKSEASFAEEYVGGGGGGYSTLFPTPWYQLGVPGVNRYSAVQWLTPVANNMAWQFNASAPIVRGTGQGRNIPDLAMNADPQTGYMVYSTLFGAGSNNESQYGGTSFIGPQLNGITALINEANGGRVGFWNGQIYRFATGPNSPFTPLDTTGTSNDNLFFSGTPGTVYNPSTGLGTPNVAALAADFISAGSPGAGAPGAGGPGAGGPGAGGPGAGGPGAGGPGAGGPGAGAPAAGGPGAGSPGN